MKQLQKSELRNKVYLEPKESALVKESTPTIETHMQSLYSIAEDLEKQIDRLSYIVGKINGNHKEQDPEKCEKDHPNSLLDALNYLKNRYNSIDADLCDELYKLEQVLG